MAYGFYKSRSIEAAAIESNAITSSEIASGAVGSDEIEDAAIVDGDVAAGTLTSAKLAEFVDDDAMETVSTTSIHSGASIKAYVDGEITGVNSGAGNIQSELDATQAGAGLGADGAYNADAARAYIGAAVSLDEADELLSVQLATTAAGLAAEITARGTADSDEATARGAADTALSGRLDVLEGSGAIQGVGTGSSPSFTDLVVSGNLTVSGTTTTLDVSELLVEDVLIRMASGAGALAVGQGFEIGADLASFKIDANDYFASSQDIVANNFRGNLVGAVTGNVTGNVSGNLAGEVSLTSLKLGAFAQPGANTKFSEMSGNCIDLDGGSLDLDVDPTTAGGKMLFVRNSAAGDASITGRLSVTLPEDASVMLIADATGEWVIF